MRTRSYKYFFDQNNFSQISCKDKSPKKNRETNINQYRFVLVFFNPFGELLS